MKAYLVVTGLLFALLALAHVWRTIVDWSHLREDPWLILQGPGIGLIAAGLAYWAWRLLRKSALKLRSSCLGLRV